MVEQANWRLAPDGAQAEVDVPRPLMVSDGVRQVIERGSTRGLEPRVNGLLEADQRQQSPTSFDTAVTGVAEASKKDEPWLRLKLVDQINATGDTDTLQRYRQVAILSAALAENMLYGGTELDPRDNRRDAINFAKDLDLGGQATLAFRTAAGNLIEAERYAEAHKGEVIGGRKLTDRDVTDLRASRQAIEARLETIYGDHQIMGKDGAFAKFRATLDTDPGVIADFIARLRVKPNSINEADTAFRGKLGRDLALCLLAATDERMDKGDGASAAALFKQAKGYLEAAQKVDPGHAPGDIKSMNMIVEQLKLRGLK